MFFPLCLQDMRFGGYFVPVQLLWYVWKLGFQIPFRSLVPSFLSPPFLTGRCFLAPRKDPTATQIEFLMIFHLPSSPGVGGLRLLPAFSSAFLLLRCGAPPLFPFFRFGTSRSLSGPREVVCAGFLVTLLFPLQSFFRTGLIRRFLPSAKVKRQVIHCNKS